MLSGWCVNPYTPYPILLEVFDKITEPEDSMKDKRLNNTYILEREL